MAFTPLLPTGYESLVGLTNGKDLDWFHRPSFAVDTALPLLGFNLTLVLGLADLEPFDPSVESI